MLPPYLPVTESGSTRRRPLCRSIPSLKSEPRVPGPWKLAACHRRVPSKRSRNGRLMGSSEITNPSTFFSSSVLGASLVSAFSSLEGRKGRRSTVSDRNSATTDGFSLVRSTVRPPRMSLGPQRAEKSRRAISLEPRVKTPLASKSPNSSSSSTSSRRPLSSGSRERFPDVWRSPAVMSNRSTDTVQPSSILASIVPLPGAPRGLDHLTWETEKDVSARSAARSTFIGAPPGCLTRKSTPIAPPI